MTVRGQRLGSGQAREISTSQVARPWISEQQFRRRPERDELDVSRFLSSAVRVARQHFAQSHVDVSARVAVVDRKPSNAEPRTPSERASTIVVPRLHRMEETPGRPIMPIVVYVRMAADGIGWQTAEIDCWGHTISEFHFPYIGLPALDGVHYLHEDNVVADQTVNQRKRT